MQEKVKSILINFSLESNLDLFSRLHILLSDGAFQFILNSLQHKELAQMGAFALAKFCSSNSHKMNKMFPILLEVRSFIAKF